jgi:hypothetical protein
MVCSLVGESLKTVTASDGRVVAFAVWGDPDGFPVLALHGTPGCPRSVGKPMPVQVEPVSQLRGEQMREWMATGLWRGGMVLVSIVVGAVAVAALSDRNPVAFRATSCGA